MANAPNRDWLIGHSIITDIGLLLYRINKLVWSVTLWDVCASLHFMVQTFFPCLLPGLHKSTTTTRAASGQAEEEFNFQEPSQHHWASALSANGQLLRLCPPLFPRPALLLSYWGRDCQVWHHSLRNSKLQDIETMLIQIQRRGVNQAHRDLPLKQVWKWAQSKHFKPSRIPQSSEPNKLNGCVSMCGFPLFFSLPKLTVLEPPAVTSYLPPLTVPNPLICNFR